MFKQELDIMETSNILKHRHLHNHPIYLLHTHKCALHSHTHTQNTNRAGSEVSSSMIDYESMAKQ